MSDPRQTPDPARVTGKTAAQVMVPVTDLCRQPDGARDRQLLYGDSVTILGSDRGWAYVQSEKDGYCGHVKSSMLGTAVTATHKVIAPATHAYQRADIKSPDQLSLSFGSKLAVTARSGSFTQTAAGFIPAAHIAPIGEHATDPAKIAHLFIGTPYLWGGNSRLGIDCSGLVQAALLACGIPCPGDSDQQQNLGAPARSGDFQRNDLLFWKGHVALVTGPDNMIHANAHAMAVTTENIAAALARIAAAGDGKLTAHLRLDIR